jgi:hypothetical protein
VTVLAPVRYGLALSVAGQRWLGPTAAYAAVLLTLAAQGGDVGTTLAQGLAALLPAAAWLTTALIRAEPPDRLAVTASVVGGLHRARATTVVVALLWAQVWIVLSLGVTVLLARGVTVGWLVAGALGHEAALVTGVAVGALCAPPVVDRVGWGVALAATASCADLVVPHAFPVRVLVDAFGPSGGHVASTPPWLAVLAAAAAALVAPALASTLVRRVTRRRT